MLTTAAELVIILLGFIVLFMTVMFIFFGIGFVLCIERETNESYEQSFYIAMDEAWYSIKWKLSSIVERVRSL